MYCPKCGADNPATNNYCRACREELRLVAQAMKKSLPVKLAGKLDAVFDRKAERFRRDSVLMFLAGLVGSASLLWATPAGKRIWSDVFFTIICFAGSLWSYLAYKSSLSLRNELNSGVSTERTDEAAKTMSLRYCPGCGTGGQGQVRFCPACGTDLWAVREALGEEMRQSWLGKKMGAYVRQQSADDMIGQSAKGLSAFGFFYLLSTIMPWARGEPLDLIFLALAAFLMFTGLWDYLVYRRRLTSGRDLPPGPLKDAQAGLPTKEATALPSPNQVQVPASYPDTSPFSAVEETTQKLGQDRDQKTRP